MSIATMEQEHEGVVGELSIGDLNHAELEQARKDSIPPAGRYRTTEGLKLSLKRFEPRDSDPKPRVVVNGFGAVTGVSKSSLGEDIKISFLMSPERRDGEDGRPDYLHKLWLSFVNAYADATGEKAKTGEEVINYFSTYPIDINTYKGKSKLAIDSFLAVKG